MYTEYCNGILAEKKYQQEGQKKRRKLKISSYLYIVGYECGKGFESYLCCTIFYLQINNSYRIKSLGMLRLVHRCTIHDVSNDCTACIFRFKLVQGTLLFLLVSLEYCCRLQGETFGWHLDLLDPEDDDTTFLRKLKLFTSRKQATPWRLESLTALSWGTETPINNVVFLKIDNSITSTTTFFIGLVYTCWPSPGITCVVF